MIVPSASSQVFTLEEALLYRLVLVLSIRYNLTVLASLAAQFWKTCACPTDFPPSFRSHLELTCISWFVTLDPKFFRLCFSLIIIKLYALLIMHFFVLYIVFFFQVYVWGISLFALVSTFFCLIHLLVQNFGKFIMLLPFFQN